VSKIAIDGVRRSFGSVTAVSDVSLDIEDGEFFTLLGPSGCGKTTLLRMIAGFTELDAGAIRFGDKRVDTLPPHKRNIGMVFQNYAIFPNLSVAGNVAYGLKARQVASDEMGQRVGEALALVRLDGLGERWPHQLSGGQLQRVAIARALVIRPEVLLLDEPLSNLDARLRVDMRGEIRDLQQRLGITTVYVTHDQEEALAVSRRIAVMQSGRIEQLGSPEDIYRHPDNLFVAEFMGTTNVLDGVVECRDQGTVRVRLGDVVVPVESHLDFAAGERVRVCVRPEALRNVAGPTPIADGEVRIEALVRKAEFIGPLIRLDAETRDGMMLKAAILDAPQASITPGSPLILAFEAARASVFRLHR
jgi:ABC-type Fe3+/spermidine/putrescine transport system ATPase subunit